MKQARFYVLAGGEGRRMRPLTNLIPKPLLRFGPSARLMDFALYNSLLSGASEVNVLTQYRSELIERYLEEKWAPNFAEQGGRLSALPGVKSPMGTADALYRALAAEPEASEYLIVLAADQVYRMDYRPLLDFHRAHGRAATVPVLDERHPLSGRGIYVFTRALVLPYLERNSGEAARDLDRDVFPQLLADSQARAYPFPVADQAPGFWRDVDDLVSYWRAQTDLLKDSAYLFLADPDASGPEPPLSLRHLAADSFSAERWVHNSLIADTARIGEAMVEDSVIGPGAVIEDGAVVRRSVILDDAVVGKWTELDSALVGPGLKIEQPSYAALSFLPQAIPAARPLADPPSEPLRAAGMRRNRKTGRPAITGALESVLRQVAFRGPSSHPALAASAKP